MATPHFSTHKISLYDPRVGKNVVVEVTVEIDPLEIAINLGRKAFHGKSGVSTALFGAVKVTRSAA